MYKFFSSIFSLGVIFALSACGSQDEPAAPINDQQLIVNISVGLETGPDAPAFKKEWENGDLIYVIFDHDVTRDPKERTEITDGLRYMTLTYDNGNWTESFSADLQDILKGKESGIMNAIYISNPTTDEKPYYSNEGYLFPTENGYVLTCREDCAYTIENNVLTGSLTMKNRMGDESAKAGFTQFLIKGINLNKGDRCSLDIMHGMLDIGHLVEGCLFTKNLSGEWIQGFIGWVSGPIEHSKHNSDGTYFHAFMLPDENDASLEWEIPTNYNLAIYRDGNPKPERYFYYEEDVSMRVNDAIVLPELANWKKLTIK